MKYKLVSEGNNIDLQWRLMKNKKRDIETWATANYLKYYYSEKKKKSYTYTVTRKPNRTHANII